MNHPLRLAFWAAGLLVLLSACILDPDSQPALQAGQEPKAISASQPILANPGEMVRIPAGDFWMGCDRAKRKESCNLAELPLHKVYLDDYRIDRYEVTVAQYRTCIATGVCSQPIKTFSDTRPDYFENPAYANYPVIYVTWFQADEYCHWAGKRLPSEAEWEKAARGVESTRIYPWGNSTPDCSTSNIKVGFRQCTGDTAEVGSYPGDASLYGVMDLAGNVREWIKDWYKIDFYKRAAYLNPTGPDDGRYVVMRGGRFDNTRSAARVAARRVIGPFDYGAGIGFRCAASP